MYYNLKIKNNKLKEEEEKALIILKYIKVTKRRYLCTAYL